MERSIYREKNLARMHSPEDMNSYLRVTNPPVWFVLAAVIFVLIGAIIWGTVAKLETRAAGLLVSNGSAAFCYISEDDVRYVQRGATVRVGGEEYTISAIMGDSYRAGSQLDDYGLRLGGFEESEDLYVLVVGEVVPEGQYSCAIVLERISPISFLLNSSSEGTSW